MIVVSDTSPICYLLLINQIDVLQVLYKVIVISKTVADELGASESPPIVKRWIVQPPDWLQIQPTELLQTIDLEKLDLVSEMRLTFGATESKFSDSG